MPITQRNSSTATPGVWLATAAAACILSAGCGGGGDSTAQPAVAALPAPVAVVVAATPAVGTAPAPASPAIAASAGADCGIADFQAALLARVNQWRATGASCRSAGVFAAAAPLTWNAKLLQAATGHSQDMVTHDFFSHTGFDGRTPAQRIDAAGYAWLGVGENIAAGYATVSAVVDGWMASDGHCANIMQPIFKETGVACLPGSAADTYKTYWTMELGKPA